jgi:hypothetical protein
MVLGRLGVGAVSWAALVGVARAQVTVTTTSTTLGASTTYSPTVAWTPNTVCSAGSSPTNNPGGGVYTDEFGQYWEVSCGQQWSGTTYYDGKGVGVNNQGMGPCFYGCALRPECMGFTYTGNQANGPYPWTGSKAGNCYHFLNNTQGTLVAGGSIGSQTVYAAAYLIQAAPGLLCPFYDNSVFNDNWGGSYSVKCGSQPYVANLGGAIQLTQTAVPNVQSCLSICDTYSTTAVVTRPGGAVVTSTSSCGLVGYSYQPSAEPSLYRNDHSSGICNLLTGTGVPTNTGAPGPYLYAERRVVTTYPTTTTTTSGAATTTVSVRI